MEHLPAKTIDSFTIAALLQSDAVVGAIQRELRTLYPGQVVPSTAIRCILRSAVLCQELLRDERSWLAQEQLDKAIASYARKTQKATGDSFPTPSLSECEESLREILWYDKTYATRGG